MARQVLAAVVMAVLAAPLVAGFAAEGGTRMCTTHACRHHSAQPKPCHQAAGATCELKCGCQGQVQDRLVSTPPYLVTPAAELVVFVESSSALAPGASSLTAGHQRLDPRPPRPRTFTL
jgi:hypothetical protein